MISAGGGETTNKDLEFVDFGHLPPMMPLIDRAMADVKAETGSFSIDMKLE